MNLDYINLLPNYANRENDGNFYKLWSVTAKQYDDLDLVAAQQSILLCIDKQSGAQLDGIGQLVGEARMGRADSLYRTILKTGILRYIGFGDIYSINEIGRAFGLSPLNITENGNPLRLDGTWLLDGTLLLDGEEKPAQFSFTRSMNVSENFGNNAEITSILDEIRAAGVLANLWFDFTMLKGQMVDYTQSYSGLLDGTWNLDGTFALSGTSQKYYTPDKIAIGDGAEPLGVLRTPQPLDTGLQNEVLRKDVVTEISPRVHVMEVRQAEAAGLTINELGIFRGTQPILMGSFTGKAKDSVTRFYFNVEE